MNIEFSDAEQFIDKLLEKEISFKSEQSHRFIINSIGEYCAQYVGRDSNYFSGSSGADDISEYLNCMLSDWEYDWFDVLTFNFDIEEITHSILNHDSLSIHYDFDSAMGFVELHVSDWCGSATSFIKQTIIDACK